MVKQTLAIHEIPSILEEHSQLIKDLQQRVEKFQASPEEPIDIFQAARFVGLAVATLYQLSSKRKIPAYKVGRHLKFYKSELDQWIKSSRRKNHELNQWLRK